MVIEVRDGESIFDVLAKNNIPLDNLYEVLQDNGISLESSVKTIAVKEYPQIPPELKTPSNSTNSIGMIKVLEGQSIFDVCLMTYGSFENMYKLIQDNDIDSINDNEIAQKTLTFDKDSIYDTVLFKNNQFNGIEYSSLYR